MIDFGSIVALGARRTPERLALKAADGSSRTFAELHERSSRLANALLGGGLASGDPVACWMEDCIEYVEAYLAIAKAGLVMVPVNTRLAVPEVQYQLEQSGARGLVYTAGLGPRVEELPEATEMATVLATVGAGETPPLGTVYEDALAAASAVAPPAPDPDSPYMICYTSGTTGRPKGATLTHRSVRAVAFTQLVAMRVPVNGVNVHAVSMSFPATVTCHILPTLMAGGTSLLVAGPWDTEGLLDTIARERATFLYVPGPVLGEFADAAEARPERWQTLTAVLHAGSRADPAALRRLADVVGGRYLEGWGMTENSGGVATATSSRDVYDPHRPDDFFESVGRPVPGAEVVVLGEDGEPLERDRDNVGELAIRTESLFAGYWRNPEASADSIRDGWYLTGDIGSMSADGSVYIADRRTNMIASGGMNVYPAEIEMVLERCPGVREVGVTGVPHERWGTTPVAAVISEPDADLSEEDIIAFARENLASYKKPTSVVFVAELPRTIGGKLQRKELRELIEKAESPA
ncbi:MAG: AMP-binding protein [Solirubrobacterales bacterium]